MRWLLINIILPFLFAYSGSVNAQTVFATETFGTGSAAGTLANGFVGDMGTWTVTNTGTNGGSSNNWYVSGEECGNAAGSCGSVCSGGDNSLHISAIGGLCGVPDCGAAYDETSGANQTNQRAESPVIDCSGLGNITLNFNYIAAQADDVFSVEYSPDGAVWSTLVTPAASQCCACNDAFLCAFLGMCCGGPPGACTGAEQGLWTAYSIALPASADNNANVHIAFNWSNDGNGIGTDPSVAIDDITITHDIVLPVELISFSGTSEGPLTTINWSTLSELNSDYFDVEHSIDGVFYRPIATVAGKGNSNEKINYSINYQTDTEINYYRLKQVDLNGEYSYSKPIQIKNDLSGILVIKREEMVSISGLNEKVGSVQIIDASGKIIQSNLLFDRETDKIEIRTSEFEHGIYFVIIETESERLSFKILN